MLRSVGSIIFGIAADRYGRKWPFVVNNLLFIVLELVGFPFSTLPLESNSLTQGREPVSVKRMNNS
jgi:MFS family permease